MEAEWNNKTSEWHHQESGSVARGYPATYLVPNRFPDRPKTDSAALRAAAHDYHDFADPDQIMSEIDGPNAIRRQARNSAICYDFPL